MSTTTSGYEPEYMQYHVAHFVLIVVFSGFAITAVILRFWARKIQKQGFALHDYLTALGLVSIPRLSRVEPQSLMMNNDRYSHWPRVVSIFMVNLLYKTISLGTEHVQ